MVRKKISEATRKTADGQHALDLQIDGLHCASCVARIQKELREQKDVSAQIDLVSGHGVLRWRGAPEVAEESVAILRSLGYTASPLGEERGTKQEGDTARFLLRCLALSGAATLLVMALSMVAASSVYFMAGVTVATLLYAGRPFYESAFRALRGGHANMDVPITAALFLTTGMSLFEVFHRGTYTYFDSVVMLLFLLLIGRYLDSKTRGRARQAASELLAAISGRARIVENGQVREIGYKDLSAGMILLVAAGERIAADGVIKEGRTEIDPSLISGETVPVVVGEGEKVWGGTTNLTGQIQVEVTAVSENSLIGEIIKLMARAQQSHGRFVRLADRVAGYYTPAVFLFACVTFFGWWLGMEAPWQEALLTTSTVLIITCPCAMGLAVPSVQVLASSRLFKKGILLKTSDALEKLETVDCVVFDKTGTLTLGTPQLEDVGSLPAALFCVAASIASRSRHPLARALARAYQGEMKTPEKLVEQAGAGVEAVVEGVRYQLGRASWVGEERASSDGKPEMWLAREDGVKQRFAFTDTLREDAREVIARLKQKGFALYLFSGDRAAAVQDVARELGFENAQGALSPQDKNQRIEELRAKGCHVLMVGDGLNDAAALAAADVSLSPSSALDITQNAADAIFQGKRLVPVLDLLTQSRRAGRLVRQNIALSALYNVLAVPLAMAGLVTPLIAAGAMSASSLVVVFNALRMRGGGDEM
jgi:Cu2+-exporting ATPase